MSGSWRIRRVRAGDAAAIADLYRPYVEHSRITFELEAPDVAEIRARISKAGDAYPYLVAVGHDDRLIGYAYATRFRDRPAYRFAVETTIYLAPTAQGRGIGTGLYDMLLTLLSAQGFVHAIGAVTLPNAASVALHERMGFRPVGSYPDVGYKFGQWAGVGLFQKALRALPEAPAEPLRLSQCPEWAAIEA